MELNLAVSSVRITCTEQPPSVEGVQLRETRSSYFLNIKLQGLRKEDIQLEMDKERCLVIRGEKYYQDMGMLRWKWRVVESHGSPSKAFKVPEDVNVGGIRASFEQGMLQLAMPKLTHNRFTPYHVFHIHSSHHPSLVHRPHQPHQQQQANNMGDKLATISEDSDTEMEDLSPEHQEEEDGKMSVEEQCREVPARECASNSVQLADDSMKKAEEKKVNVSQSENEEEKQEDVVQEKRGHVEETIVEGIEAQETAGASSFNMSSASDAQAKRGPLLPEEAAEEKEKKANYEKGKEERAIGNGYMESERSEHSKPFLCEGLSHIFSLIAVIARRKQRC